MDTISITKLLFLQYVLICYASVQFKRRSNLKLKPSFTRDTCKVRSLLECTTCAHARSYITISWDLSSVTCLVTDEETTNDMDVWAVTDGVDGWITLTQMSDVYCPMETASLRTSIYQDACYLFIESSTTYDQARTGCDNYGGRMVKFYDNEVMQFVSNTVTYWNMVNWNLWIGMEWEDSEWQWNDGTSVSLDYWLPGEGGTGIFGIKFQKCAVMLDNGGTWGWDDVNCDDSYHGYVCQV